MSKSSVDERPTRERILDAAAELMHRHGYGGTTMTAVQKAAGVHGGSLAYFFPTKEDLLVGVLGKYRDLLDPVIMGPAFASEADPLERVFAVLDRYRALLLSQDFAMGCPIGTLALEVGADHPPVLEGLTAAFGDWRAAIRSCLEEAAPHVRDDVDIEAMASFVLTVMEGAVLLARGHRDIRPFDTAVGELRSYIQDRVRRE